MKHGFYFHGGSINVIFFIFIGFLGGGRGFGELCNSHWLITHDPPVPVKPCSDKSLTAVSHHAQPFLLSCLLLVYRTRTSIVYLVQVCDNGALQGGMHGYRVGRPEANPSSLCCVSPGIGPSLPGWLTLLLYLMVRFFFS